MAILIQTSANLMPGLNWETPVDLKSLSFIFDNVFSSEQRARLQLLGGVVRSGGMASGVVDEFNPTSAVPGSGRPLTVQPNTGNNLNIDVLSGMAVTRAGNVIAIDDVVQGIPLATYAVDISNAVVTAVVNVVFVEYKTVDDASTNVVTDYDTVQAVRRVICPSYTAGDASSSIIQVVTLSDFQDPSKFSAARLNDVVVLALVRVVANSTAATPPTVLSIDTSNNVNAFVRPWFSAVDVQHRSYLGTGTQTDTNTHAVGFNDISAGALTLYQQSLQHGIVIARDLDVPGCPGKLCSELVDNLRVLTDGSGDITGTAGRQYVYLLSYPVRLLGCRGNKLSGTDVVPDTSLGAATLAAELIPGTNVLAMGCNSITGTGGTLEVSQPVHGFTVYYTASDAARPPVLPGEVTKIQNSTVQFGAPISGHDLLCTGGKAFASLPNTTVSLAKVGSFPLRYTCWLDASEQFLIGPQVVSCQRVVNTALGIGSAVQTPDFAMYGPARLRVGLYNAPAATATVMLQVELSGKDATGAALTEAVQLSGTSGTALPQQIAWSQPGNLFQITTSTFATLDSWKINTSTDLGPNAMVSVWAEIGPTVTPALDDALPVASLNWNGSAVDKIIDLRPVHASLADASAPFTEQEHAITMATALGSGTWNTAVIAAESFKRPRMQDTILSSRNRHGDRLMSFAGNESRPDFDMVDGTSSTGREWYYSQPVCLPATQNNVLVELFGDQSAFFRNSFGAGGDVVIWAAVAPISSPTSWSYWFVPAAITPASNKLKMVDLTTSHSPVTGPYFKIKFRIMGKGLSGFAAVLKTS